MLGLRLLPCRHWAKLIHPHTYSLSSSFSSFPASAYGEDVVTAPNKSRSPAPRRPRGAGGCGGGRRPGGCRRPELRPRRRRPRDGAAPPVSSRDGGRPVTQPRAARRAAGADVRGGTAGGRTDSSRFGGDSTLFFFNYDYFYPESAGHVSLLSAPGALRGKAPHWAQPRAPGRGVCVCPSESACPCVRVPVPAALPLRRVRPHRCLAPWWHLWLLNSPSHGFALG